MTRRIQMAPTIARLQLVRYMKKPLRSSVRTVSIPYRLAMFHLVISGDPRSSVAPVASLP
jgi:hypothetical protein